jgi:hypothetical protein
MWLQVVSLGRGVSEARLEESAEGVFSKSVHLRRNDFFQKGFYISQLCVSITKYLTYKEKVYCYYFLAVLGFKLRFSNLLGRCSTTCDISLALFDLVYFLDKVSHLCTALTHDPPTATSQVQPAQEKTYLAHGFEVHN